MNMIPCPGCSLPHPENWATPFCASLPGMMQLIKEGKIYGACHRTPDGVKYPEGFSLGMVGRIESEAAELP